MQCTLEEEYVRGREQEGLTHEDEVRMVSQVRIGDANLGHSPMYRGKKEKGKLV